MIFLDHNTFAAASEAPVAGFLSFFKKKNNSQRMSGFYFIFLKKDLSQIYSFYIRGEWNSVFILRTGTLAVSQNSINQELTLFMQSMKSK